MNTDFSSPWVLDLELMPPSVADNRADADRLLRALEESTGGVRPTMDLEILNKLQSVLRDCSYRVRCTIGTGMDGVSRLVDIRDVDSEPPLGLALDLGTSRISFQILNLVNGDILTRGDFKNPQSKIAVDVLARAHHASTDKGTQELQSAIVEAINHAIKEACEGAGLDCSQVVLVVLAGNTIMTQLLLGLGTRWIIREPYTPVINAPGIFYCNDVGLKFALSAGLFVFPNVGAYFGGDLISGILYSGLHRSQAVSILVDVGTNAEVVLGNSEWLVACAGAAGPALESGVARIGMLAGEGVIDRVWLNEDTGELEYHVIGGEKARGICGSGIIDLAACLFRSGRMDLQGKLVADACGERYRNREGNGEFVLVPAHESATGRELSIDDREFASLKKAKAAMYTILETITSSVGLSLNGVEQFYIAGSFGSVIDPESAISIGMLPDLPRERFKAIGNSSLMGAVSLLGNASLVDEVVRIRERVTYMELNVNQEFMARFNAANFFPHTDLDRFPSTGF